MQDLVLTPSDFVALANQSLEFAFGLVTVEGELSSFSIRKNRWVYFDIKDAESKIRCFGTVYMLPGPLEDGMLVRIVAAPRLHPQFGFSLNCTSIVPAGEGALKKAYDLLRVKLTAEGLFAAERKRRLPTIPQHIALVASIESAAYADFVKIIGTRWPFAKVTVYDSQVQGDVAPQQLVRAIEQANHAAELPDVLVVTRGGGSNDDLAAFDDERVVRAIAASRIPSLVAIGHEIDTSLAELAADMRASTPSNAAEMVVPDKQHERALLRVSSDRLRRLLRDMLSRERYELTSVQHMFVDNMYTLLAIERSVVDNSIKLLTAYDPRAVLQRGYAMVYSDSQLVTSSKQLRRGMPIGIVMHDGQTQAIVQSKLKGYGHDKKI